MFNRVQVQALGGPFKDIQRHTPNLSLKPCLACMFKVVVMLRDEPLPPSEIVCTQDEVFFEDV